MNTVIDLFLHIDKLLPLVMDTYGSGIYFILFLIIFSETGLVFFPFLPGDSLLFAAGALAAVSGLSMTWLWILLVFAAIFGDFVNYRIGDKMGKTLSKSRWVNSKHLEKSQRYFEKHGAKAIVLARFIPIVRTFIPFIAGLSKMPYPRFMGYNFLGGIAWVSIFLFSGFYFGNTDLVQNHFKEFIIVIILASFLPLVVDGIQFLIRKGESRGA